MEQQADAEIDIVRGGGGAFDIDVNGQRVYSKRDTGRFPTDDEVRNAVS